MLDTIFLIAAVIGGTVLVCQFVLTLLGMGSDGADVAHDGGDFHGDGHVGGDFHGEVGDVPGGDFAGDHHTSVAAAADAEYQHPDSSWLFGVISFRSLVAAAAFFGVAGKAALSAGYADSTSLVLATLVGVAAMYGMYGLMRLIAGLSSSGNERITNALGRKATVYVPIPADRQGAGKVQLSMQNRIVEFQAVTDGADRLKTGEAVQVVGIAGSDTVRVRRVAEKVSAPLTPSDAIS
jgi:hypothetical protein